jgi:imidazolonepropionase
MNWDLLITNASLATFADETGYGFMTNAAIACKGDKIVWIGPASTLPDLASAPLAYETHDVDGALVTPGLIDCHTHLVFGGNRAQEFDLRLNGASYEDIARAGGGIVSTVRATRDASEEALLKQAHLRAAALLADGVTTLEIKSGYGLELESERRMLRVARRVGVVLGMQVQTSFLGLHALPPEYKDRRTEYVDLVCNELLPVLADEGLLDAVDAFCEGIGFTRAETQRVFEHAQQLGLRVKLHAEQLSDLDGAALVAEFNGLSADHLEYLSDAGIQAMARAGTVAVLLPGAFYALRETKLPPVDALPWRADCDCDGLQSRDVAAAVTAVGGEYGLHPVPADAGRSLARHHGKRGARAGPDRSRHVGGRPARRSGGMERGAPCRVVLLDRWPSGTPGLAWRCG